MRRCRGGLRRGLVAERAANDRHRCVNGVDLVAVELGHLGHVQIAIAVGHSAARDDLFEGHLGQVARDLQHGLVTRLRGIVGQRQGDAGCVEAKFSKNSSRFANSCGLIEGSWSRHIEKSSSY